MQKCVTRATKISPRKASCMFQFTVPKKMATGYIYPYFLAYGNPKNVHKNAQNSSKNFEPSIHNVVGTRTNFTKNIQLSIFLMVVLGSQGIVVKMSFSVRWIARRLTI